MKLKSNLNEKRNIYYVQEGKFVILSYYQQNTAADIQPKLSSPIIKMIKQIIK